MMHQSIIIQTYNCILYMQYIFNLAEKNNLIQEHLLFFFLTQCLLIKLQCFENRAVVSLYCNQILPLKDLRSQRGQLTCKHNNLHSFLFGLPIFFSLQNIRGKVAMLDDVVFAIVEITRQFLHYPGSLTIFSNARILQCKET